MIKNKKGTITLLGIYICLLFLFLAIISKSILLENYHYYKFNNNKYNLFLIENAIVKNIYDDYKNVNYSNGIVSYKSIIKVVNDDIHYTIKLSVYSDIYEYNIIYDNVCEKIIEFNNVSVINEIV
ncbi:hypothetical protein OKW22_000408 [Bacilli bacterium PM5-3]|nr:hypothetical protein [Bacilli bacterium PM5-3]MDH6603073.1 hypothetical protein [Bacilli bacterium PM5-9]